MGLNAGDEVSFDWEGIGGEQIDVFAYLLERMTVGCYFTGFYRH